MQLDDRITITELAAALLQPADHLVGLTDVGPWQRDTDGTLTLRQGVGLAAMLGCCGIRPIELAVEFARQASLGASTTGNRALTMVWNIEGEPQTFWMTPDDNPPAWPAMWIPIDGLLASMSASIARHRQAAAGRLN